MRHKKLNLSFIFSNRLNPRRNFSLKLGVTAGIIALVFVLLLGLIVGVSLRQDDEARSGTQFAELAFQMTDKLDRIMFERYREMQIIASLYTITSATRSIDTKRQLLEELQTTYTDYAWIGLTDTDGIVVASTGKLLEGVDVSQRPWFINGISAPYVGDVHEAVLLASFLPNPSSEPLRFVDVSAPVYDADGVFMGVLGSHLSWSWVSDIRESVLSPVYTRLGIEMLVLSADGTVLLGPPNFQLLQNASALTSTQNATTTSNGYVIETWNDGITYLVGYSQSVGFEAYPGLGWIVIVRQPIGNAFARDYALQQSILLSGLVIGLLSTIVIWRVSGGIVKPIITMSKVAEQIRMGDANASIPNISGDDEIASLSTSFHQLIETLTERNKQLEKAANRFHTLHSIDKTILKSNALNSSVKIGLQFLQSLLPLQVANVTIYDWEKQEGIFINYTDGQNLADGTRINLNDYSQENFASMRAGQIPIIADIMTMPNKPVGIATLQKQGLRSYTALPLLIEDNLMGSINLGANYPNAFTPDFMEVAEEIASQLAIAIQQVHYREQIQHHIAELEQRVQERTSDLTQAKNRIEAVLNSSSDMIILSTLGGIIEQSNPAVSQFLGYELHDLDKQSLLMLFEQNSIEMINASLATLVSTQQPCRIEVLARRKDGSVFDGDLALAPVVEDGMVKSIVASLRDVSERRQIERALQESEQAYRNALAQEKELTKLRTRFISMVSHDFRTPLTVIRSSADMLQLYNERMDEIQKTRQFDKIFNQINRMVRLLNDVLTISQGDAGAISVNPIMLDLDQFCRNLADEFQGNTDIQHTLIYTGLDEPVIMLIDENLLQRAVTNLLTNAFKYSPSNKNVHLDLSIENDCALIRVRDYGMGIPLQDQPRLFEAFQRAGNVGTIQGTGLGLAIVKRSVEAHGGTITFESNVGEGTTFTITIPLNWMQYGSESSLANTSL